MSRARGLVLQNALARYLAQWWPHAESAGAGRQGTDILGTPGVVWECKTAREFRPLEWCRQARSHARMARCDCAHIPEIAWCEHADKAVTVYWPDGIGEQSASAAIAMMPLADMVGLLREAGYGEPKGVPACVDPDHVEVTRK